MTTRIPTSDGAAGLVPADLPDENLMNRLAGEFFAAMPGVAGMFALPSGGASRAFTSAASQPDAQVPVATPAVLAASAPPVGAPYAQAPSIANIPTPRVSAVTDNAKTYAVPDIPNAATPGMQSAPVPSTPYYFLGESSSYQSSSGDLDAVARQAQPVNGGDRVTAQAFGLPGADELHQLLSGIDPTAAGDGGTERLHHDAGPNFYFQQGALQNGVPAWDEAPRLDQRQLQGYPAFDVNAIRRDFPILSERVNGRQLVWFDNAATTHKPQAVIDRLAYFYAHENSNIHRAAHELAARATDAYESARNKVARFLGAGSPEEIIFVRGATEAINLVAQTFGKQFIGAGDEIVVSHLEHHANIVPWQQLAAEKGAKIRVIPVDDSGQILLDEYRKLLNDKTKLVAVTQVSNALGTITPIKEIVELAHRAGARALVDGAQAVSHMRVNVQALDADFYVFSGHKIFGPTGIGVVYGKKDLLEQLPPWQGGGNMIADVTFEKTIYQGVPMRFEAGTGNIADAVGLGAALDYLERIGLENVARYEHALLEYATHHLRSIPGVRLIGTAQEKASVASFVLDGYRTEEVGGALSEEGIAVRSGHHCAQPILRRFGVEATVRPSFAFYNTCEEIDRMIAVVRRLSGAKR